MPAAVALASAQILALQRMAVVAITQAWASALAAIEVLFGKEDGQHVVAIAAGETPLMLCVSPLE